MRYVKICKKNIYWRQLPKMEFSTAFLMQILLVTIYY